MVVRRLTKRLIIIAIVVLLMIITGLKIILNDKHQYNYDYLSIKGSSTQYHTSLNNKNGRRMLPVRIDAFENFKDERIPFTISEDTLIRVKAVGEGADYSINPYLFKSYDNDGVELYFDMKNQKFPVFDIHGDDRQYRILLKSNLIDGQNIDTVGMKVIEVDPSATSYIIEITLPWKSLGYVIPRAGLVIGFDVAVLDNDGGTLKALYNWKSKSADSWKNTSFYGDLKLIENKESAINSNLAYAREVSRRLASTPKNLDLLWDHTIQYPLRYASIGYVTGPSDLSGAFKTLWDKNNLYIRVEVNDNIKSYAKALFDYGWIEDSLNNIVWTMEMDKTKYAGGALKNRYIDTIISLKKGNYILRYTTDESHSPFQWDGLPPTDSLYGIEISYSPH